MVEQELGVACIDRTRSIDRRHAIARLFVFFLFFLTVFAAQKISEVLPLIQLSLKKAEAITTPFGILYFTDNPSQFIINHEQCHYERLQEIGAFAFYTDYFLGGGCAEEQRCMYTPSESFIHPICTYQEYMGWDVPDFDVQYVTTPSLYVGFSFEEMFVTLSDALLENTRLIDITVEDTE